MQIAGHTVRMEKYNLIQKLHTYVHLYTADRQLTYKPLRNFKFYFNSFNLPYYDRS
jgi:hypothetical protein